LIWLPLVPPSMIVWCVPSADPAILRGGEGIDIAKPLAMMPPRLMSRNRN
jgi:hypothetical protein